MTPTVPALRRKRNRLHRLRMAFKILAEFHHSRIAHPVHWLGRQVAETDIDPRTPRCKVKIVITDLLVSECELTGKPDVECVRVRLDDASPEAVIAASEVMRLIRFKKKQLDKQAEAATPKGPKP
jgi:hypothetical protein